MTGRREFSQMTWTVVGTLSLPALLRVRAQAGPESSPERTSVIVVGLCGGMSHPDPYDPKPDAPAEYRVPFAPIAMRIPACA